eukprot:10572576-Lingulodinium_polyedra.AAC.1
MRVCLMAVQRSIRAGASPGHRSLCLTDNLTACCCLEKGRARSWALNALCKRVAAYSLGCQARFRWRHIDSKRN